MNQKDKVAVVTGASGGIGAVTARCLAEADAQMIVGCNGKCVEASNVATALPGSAHRATSIPMLDTSVILEVAATVERDFRRYRSHG